MRIGKIILITVIVKIFGLFIFNYTRPTYPIFRTLVNDQGKMIEVNIEGKEGDKIIVDRLPNLDRFEIEIDTLSLKDRLYCFRLLDSPAPPKIVEEAPPKEDNYIVTRRKAIVELQKKEKVITEEIASKTLNELLHQNRIEQLERVQEEIRELELAIKTYQYRMKQ